MYRTKIYMASNKYVIGPHVIRNYDMQDYINNQVTHFNLHVDHVKNIDMTQY